MRIILWMTVFFVFPVAAQAIDFATEHTQILNYYELITDNLRQLQSLENQIQMIANQVQELRSVANYQNDFTDEDALRDNLNTLTSQGTALSNRTQAILNQMQQAVGPVSSSGTLVGEDAALDQSTLNIIQSAVSRAAQIRGAYQQQVDSVNSLMNKNDQAVGQT